MEKNTDMNQHFLKKEGKNYRNKRKKERKKERIAEIQQER